MPMMSTKNFRLASGFGVSISMWPRWARSKIGSGVIVLLLRPESSVRHTPRRRSIQYAVPSSTAETPRNTGSSAFADDDTVRELRRRASDVVEQLIDREGARNQLLLHAIFD